MNVRENELFFFQRIFPFFEESCPQSLPEGALSLLQPCPELTFVALPLFPFSGAPWVVSDTEAPFPCAV